MERFIQSQISGKNSLVTKYAPGVVNKNSSKAGAVVYLKQELLK